jgi:hypothetical protein
MANRPGRNALCPCGSGRKYKACCLPADEASERAGLAALPGHRPPFVDRLEFDDDPDAADELDAVWERFTDADYEEQIATFEDALATRTVDGDTAFEMLSEIHAEAVTRGERGRIRALLERFARELPTLYARDAHYYAGWLIDEALATGDVGRLPALLAPLAEHADEAIGEVLEIARQLAYHGHVAPIVDAMQRGWPAVERSKDIHPEVRLEYAGLLSDLLVDQYVATAPNPRPDDPALAAQVEPYLDVEEAAFQQNVAALLGQLGRNWRAADFESPPRS